MIKLDRNLRVRGVVLMSEILSRWSRKPLSQILYILSGIMLMILLCNYYTAINIQVDFLDFISLDYNNLKETSTIMWIFAILIFENYLFQFLKFLLKVFFPVDPVDIEESERRYYDILVLLQTIEDIVELITSVYALIFLVISYRVYMDNGIFCKTSYAIITYCGVALRFCGSVYFHFYVNNRSIIDGYLRQK